MKPVRLACIDLHARIALDSARLQFGYKGIMPPFGSTNCRDRTPEFLAIVQRLQRQQARTVSTAEYSVI